MVLKWFSVHGNAANLSTQVLVFRNFVLVVPCLGAHTAYRGDEA